MRTRSERRHHHQRMLNKVKNFGWLKSWFGTEEIREEHIRQITETRKPCSCHMCGNPRKHFKQKTLQEKRMDEYALGDDQELNSADYFLDLIFKGGAMSAAFFVVDKYIIYCYNDYEATK